MDDDDGEAVVGERGETVLLGVKPMCDNGDRASDDVPCSSVASTTQAKARLRKPIVGRGSWVGELGRTFS